MNNLQVGDKVILTCQCETCSTFRRDSPNGKLFGIVKDLDKTDSLVELLINQKLSLRYPYEQIMRSWRQPCWRQDKK